MTTSSSTTTLAYTVLGQSNLTGGLTDIAQLPNGDLFVLQYDQNGDWTAAAKNTIEFLAPTATSITNVTAQMSSGALPTNANVVNINTLYVGNNALPDIVLCDQGIDSAPWNGAQVRLLVPNASGQYVDETSLLPQQLAQNHRLSTGTIDGHAAIVVDEIGNGTGKPVGVELLVANSDGTFSDWSSHIPASIQTSVTTSSGFSWSPNGVFTVSAIADFTGSGAGDIFLGSENMVGGNDPAHPDALIYNQMLVNNGQGYFTDVPITAPLPTFADGGAPVAVFALPIKFQGDAHEDLIVAYADSTYTNGPGNLNPTGNGYYLQFLKGDGTGNFTDVTSQHLAVQPTAINSANQNEWITSVQQVTINGFNDLILYLSTQGLADGGAIILANDGHDHYSPSNFTLPANLMSVTWGTDNGVGGFYGLNSSNQWVFVPVTTVLPTAATISDTGANIAKSLDGLQAGLTQGNTVNVTITNTAPVFIGGGSVPVVTASVSQLMSDTGILSTIMAQNAHSAVEVTSGAATGWVEASSNQGTALTALANLMSGQTATLTGMTYGDELIYDSAAAFVANTPAAGLQANYVSVSSFTTNVNVNIGAGVGYVSVWDSNANSFHSTVNDAGSSARYDFETANAMLNLSSTSAATIELNNAWYGEHDLTVNGWVHGKDVLSLAEPNWQSITTVSVQTGQVSTVNTSSSHTAYLIQLGNVGAGDASTVASAAAVAYHPSTTGTDAYGVYFAGTTSAGNTTIYAFTGDTHGTITGSDLVHAVTLVGVSSVSASDLVAA